MRTSVLWLAVLILVAMSCSSSDEKPDVDAKETISDLTAGELDAPETDTFVPLQCDVGQGVVCCPGDTNGCSEDFRSILLCNEDGTGWDLVDCIGDDGELSQCLVSVVNPGGYCANCIPGTKRCLDDDIVQQCGQFGLKWESFADCSGADTGQICLQGGCVKLCDINDKYGMYMGCDFWAVDLDNAFVPGGRTGFYDAAGSQYSVVVSNPNAKHPATVQIFTIEGEVLYDSEDNLLPTEPLMPGDLRIYNLPRRDADGTVLAPLAYRVQASVPITTYQFNPLQNVDVFSNDASLLLPSNVAGKYYIVMTREQTFDELRSFLTVVAVRSGETQVTIDVTAPTLVGENVHTGESIKHLEPGETFKATLNQYDVLNIESDSIGSDLTGSVVLANRDVVVYGGSEASNAPNTNHCLKAPGDETGLCEWDNETNCKDNTDCIEFNTCCADHLEQQLFPVKSWGLRYLASKTFPRNKERDVYRILAAENNTQVTTLPPQTSIPVLNKGEWVDFESDQNFEIIAKKPILVGQFLAAQDAPDPNVNGVPQAGMDAGIGDPAFILLVPVEQFRQDYVFLAPDKYELDYVTIIAPVDDDGIVLPVWFDCDAVKPVDIAANCDPLEPDDFELFGTGEYATTKFLVEDGVHKVYSEAPAAVFVYGYDQYVSYGYPAGLNIQDLGLITEPGEQ